MNSRPDQNEHAIKNLLSCYQYWSELKINPVLDLLDNADLITNKKYPDPALKCHGDLLRVFYHYHEQPFQYDDEHGHFHYFIKTGNHGGEEKEWCHIAGLCIDSSGQPIRWFTTNHWVTGSTWLKSGELTLKLNLVQNSLQTESPLQQWLVSILILFKSLIVELFDIRDKKLSSLTNTSSQTLKDLHQDRKHYILSEGIFDLYTYISNVNNVNIIPE